MAERRMFSKTIIDSDVFLDMPLSTQALYFHLAMRADDDGFINNPKKIMRMVGAAQNEFELLLAKRYIIGFDSGVVVIKHWKIHNYIQSDRYKPTVYIEEKEQLKTKGNKSYTELDTRRIQDVSIMDAQVRLDKYSIEKNTCASESAYSSDFEEWWTAYPKKRSKEAAFKAWKKAKSKLPALDRHIQIVKNWSMTDDWKKEGGQFIPYPQKWLSEGKWMDELASNKQASNNKWGDRPLLVDTFCTIHPEERLRGGICYVCEEERNG
jgi:hypothetical protein